MPYALGVVATRLLAIYLVIRAVTALPSIVAWRTLAAMTHGSNMLSLIFTAGSVLVAMIVWVAAPRITSLLLASVPDGHKSPFDFQRLAQLLTGLLGLYIFSIAFASLVNNGLTALVPPAFEAAPLDTFRHQAMINGAASLARLCIGIAIMSKARRVAEWIMARTETDRLESTQLDEG